MAEPTTAEPPSRSRFAEALRPLASRPYRLMWMGSTTSSIGDAVVQIALVFAILHVGGTASDIGVIAAVSTVARIAFVLAGGVWADRLRRQYVMLSADAVRGVVQGTLAVLLLSGHAHVWELGVGAAVYGAATMLRDSGEHPVILREAVTSPAGTTIAAIRELENHAVRAAFIAAIESARDRSRELAGG